MSMVASIHGRIGRNPETRQTKNGNEMCSTSIAVDLTPGNAETPETLWVKVLAFGHLAAELGRCSKGEMVSAFGRVTQERWTAKDGAERTSWTLIADGLVTTRSARPAGGKAKADGKAQKPRDLEPLPFDDEIPF